MSNDSYRSLSELKPRKGLRNSGTQLGHETSKKIRRKSGVDCDWMNERQRRRGAGLGRRDRE